MGMPCAPRARTNAAFPRMSPSLDSLHSLQVRADLAASFQATAIRHLEDRTARAVAWAQESCPGIRCVGEIRRRLGARVATECELTMLLSALGEADNCAAQCNLRRMPSQACLLCCAVVSISRLLPRTRRRCTSEHVFAA